MDHTSTVTRPRPAPVGARSRHTASHPRFRLGRQARRAILVVHLWAVGGWFGMDLVLAVLFVRAWTAGTTAERAANLQALELVGVVPMIALAVLSLASGVLLGLGSPFGLVRYWWVLIKLVINGLFVVLLLLALRPGLRDAMVTALFGAGDSGDGLVLALSLSGLATAVVVSVFKPWGHVRPAAPARPARRRAGGTRAASRVPHPDQA